MAAGTSMTSSWSSNDLVLYWEKRSEQMGGGLSRVAPQDETGGRRLRPAIIFCCFYSQPPSSTARLCPLEVKSWGESFDKLMKCPAGIKYFRQFLQGEFCDENLSFWVAVQDYKKKDVEQRYIAAKFVHDSYLAAVSPSEVSIDGATRKQIEAELQDPGESIFDSAAASVYNLMKRDCYPRFIRSPLYRDLL